MIQVSNVGLRYGDRKLFEDVNIKFTPGNCYGLIGANGAGKSTFLKCLYRNLKPTSGVIKLDDIDLSNITVKESAKKIAVVAQHNYYNFDFSVLDIVLMGRSPHKKIMERDSKDDYEIVENVLKKVDMIEYKDRNFSSLSGGEQQRIILARALAQDTECLILDEPTNHLDIKYQLQLMNILKSLEIEVIAAIHDLNIALMYCDKIYVLKDGNIIAYGNPNEILTRELIKEVYEVDSIINKDKKGNILSISYKSYIK